MSYDPTSSSNNRPGSITSNNSLRCDSASSDEYLEISSSPEPLRILNRYRELCRIFRVRQANSFIVKLLLKFAWGEIQSQLAIIRNNKLIFAKQQQLKEYKLQLQIELQEREKQEKMIREQQRKGIISSSPTSQQQQTQQQTQQHPKKSVRIAEEGNITTFFDDSSNNLVSPAANNNINQNNTNNNNGPITVEDLIPLIQELEDEISQSQILTYQPYLWREGFQILDCSRTYLGPRGLIAVAALVAEMPWMLELNFSYMAWYNCDERSSEFCPTGEEVLRVVCLLLSNHPSLEVLILDGNDFATNSYMWLADFCKKNASQMKLKKISVEDTLLEDFQKHHLQGILDRNESRREKYAKAELERMSDTYGRNFYASATNSNNNNKKSSITTTATTTHLGEGKVGFAESFAASVNNSSKTNINNNRNDNDNARERMLQTHRKEKMEKSMNSNNASLASAPSDALPPAAGENKQERSGSTIATTGSNLPYAQNTKVSHLPSGPTSHRRGWNLLLQFCTHHPEFIRWSVLVTRELCQTVFTSSDSHSKNSQQVVPLTPSKDSSKQRNSSKTDRSPLSHSPARPAAKSSFSSSTATVMNSSTTAGTASSSQHIPVNSANAQSMIYLMSGSGPNVLPGLRDSLIHHPFTTENCRFKTTPAIHQVLETVFKCNPVLSLLDDAAKADVISRGRIIKRTSRSVIMEAGDPCDFVYLVLHGGLEIRGRPQVLAANAFEASARMNAAAANNNNNASMIGNPDKSAKAAFLASSSLNNNNNSGSLLDDGNNNNQRQGVSTAMLTYFASPSVFPTGAFVGGEEIVQPNITQNERRTATIITTPCCVLPPVLCRRALIRQTISVDSDKAEQFMSNLPIVEACYDNSALLERANTELDYAVNATNKKNEQQQEGMMNNNTNSNSLAPSRSFNSGTDVSSGLTKNQNQQQQRSISPSSADPHRGEKNATIDDDGEGLELEAENHGTLRLERWKQLYGIQSPQDLREIEQRVYQNRLLSSSADDEKETAVRKIEERLMMHKEIEEEKKQQQEQQEQEKEMENDENNEDTEQKDAITSPKTPSSRRNSPDQDHQKATAPGGGFKGDHDSVTVLFLVPRDVLVHKLLASVRDHRKQWGPFLESLPSLVSLPTHYKMCLADSMRRRQFTQGEIVGAGLGLYDLIFVILEGSATIYFQRSEVRRLSRGDFFACHPKSDVSRISVVASNSGASTNVTSASAYLSSANNNQYGNTRKRELSQLVIGVVAPTFAATLPVGLQRFLLKMRRVYSLAADPAIIQPDGS